MMYNTMKRLIKNAVAKYQAGVWSLDQYAAYKSEQNRKLDVFPAGGRLTDAEYEELIALWG